MRTLHGAAAAALVVLLLPAGCGDDDNPSGPGNDLDPSLAGMHEAGAGYDVFENYADVTKCRAHVLDAARLAADGKLERVQYEKSTFETISGVTIHEYSHDFTQKVNVEGSYMFFSGSIGLYFDESLYTSSEYSFATVQSLIRKYAIRVPLDVPSTDLKAYLTDTARTQINDGSVPPDALFAMYGTHAIRGLVVGGRMDYNVAADMTFETSGRTIGAYARASFKNSYASASIASETIDTQSMSVFESRAVRTLEIYGGKSEYGQGIISDNEYQAWIDTVSENPVFVDFEPAGLAPLWLFADDPARAQAIQDAYVAYAKTMDIVFIPEVGTALVGLRVEYTSGGNPPVIVDGHRRLPVDLNEGSGGGYVWVYYRLGADDGSDGTPIGRIYTVDTSNGESNTPGGPCAVNLSGTCIDLNKSVGGDFIYLHYLTDASNPIRAIVVKSGSTYHWGPAEAANLYDPNVDVEWCTHMGNPLVLQDLNEGAGGEFIYIGAVPDH
jgi:hypothetical protein